MRPPVLGDGSGLEAEADRTRVGVGDVVDARHRAGDGQAVAARALVEGGVEREGRAHEHLDRLAAPVERAHLRRHDVVGGDVDHTRGDRRGVAQALGETVDQLVLRRLPAFADGGQSAGVGRLEGDLQGPRREEAKGHARHRRLVGGHVELYAAVDAPLVDDAAEPMCAVAGFVKKTAAFRFARQRRPIRQEYRQAERIALDFDARPGGFESDRRTGQIDRDTAAAVAGAAGHGADARHPDQGRKSSLNEVAHGALMHRGEAQRQGWRRRSERKPESGNWYRRGTLRRKETEDGAV